MAYKKDAYGSPSGKHLEARKYTAVNIQQEMQEEKIKRKG